MDRNIEAIPSNVVGDIGSATACNNHPVDIKTNFLECGKRDCGEELLDISPGDVLRMEA
jgi:hypothetical protein